MIVVVDDQLLGRLLRGEPPAELLDDADVYTTGYWYVRLCQAVLAHTETAGRLSQPFVDLPDAIRERALAALLDLPEHIGLVSLRTLGPVIGRLRGYHALNALSIEALAASVHLDAAVLLSAPSPRLDDALTREGRACTVVGA